MKHPYHYQNSPCPYEEYYTTQAGSGNIAAIYKGAPYQRGHGIGSFLGGIFRTILPLFKSGAKAVGKEAMRTGVGVLSDMLSARPMDESVKERLKEASGNLKRKADEKIERLMSGSGRYKRRSTVKRKNTRSKASKRKGSKKSVKFRDIFSDK